MTKKYKGDAPWIYGKHPNPTNWHKAADALKSREPKPKHKGSGLHDKLDRIEQLLRSEKG